MILAALFAANCLLPPGPYCDPRDPPEVRFVDAQTVHDLAAIHGLRNEWRGVEWGYNKVGARTFAFLAEGDAKQESCGIRHALAHQCDYERTGDPNPKHIGWVYSE